MRDTFADTTRRPARPRLPLDGEPARGPGARVGMDPGARMRRACWPSRARCSLAGLRAAASPTSRRSPATRTRSSGRPARRPPRRSSGRPPASTSSASSTASRRASTGPPARLALADSYFEEGGTGNYILAVSALPGVPDPLPLPPAQRLRAVPGRRVVLPAEERPRPRPDRDRGGPRRVPAAARASTRTHPRRRRPATGSWSAARAWPARSSWPGYFYQRTRQACRAAITRYEGILNDYPDYSAPRRRAVPPVASASARPDGASRRSPTSRRLLAEYPDSALRRGRRSRSRATRRSCRPAPSPVPVTGTRRQSRRRHPRPPRPRRRRKLKCHFRICKKPLDETLLFLLASAKLPGGMRDLAAVRNQPQAMLAERLEGRRRARPGGNAVKATRLLCGVAALCLAPRPRGSPGIDPCRQRPPAPAASSGDLQTGPATIPQHWSRYKYPETIPDGATYYIIERGDTLWDLSAKFLGNPFLWPQIWDQNRYITDAHWIYPGDPLIMPRGRPRHRPRRRGGRHRRRADAKSGMPGQADDRRAATCSTPRSRRWRCSAPTTSSTIREDESLLVIGSEQGATKLRLRRPRHPLPEQGQQRRASRPATSTSLHHVAYTVKHPESGKQHRPQDRDHGLGPRDPGPGEQRDRRWSSRPASTSTSGDYAEAVREGERAADPAAARPPTRLTPPTGQGRTASSWTSRRTR